MIPLLSKVLTRAFVPLFNPLVVTFSSPLIAKLEGYPWSSRGITYPIAYFILVSAPTVS
jgi:hypothetical protein